MLRIGIIAFCVLATVAGSLALKRNTMGEVFDQRAPAKPVAVATQCTMRILTANDRRRPTRTGVSPASERLPESDTTGLLRESLTIGELLDELNADSGAGFTPVDGRRFADLLRSDPELRKAIAE